MLYIIDSKNNSKFQALMRALGKLQGQEVAILKILAENMPTVKPLSIDAARTAAIEGVLALTRTFLTGEEYGTGSATGICIQKGVSLSTSSLIAIVAIRRTDRLQAQITECEPIPLSPEIKKLVEGGMDIYDAYRKVYGDEVADKKISLFEKLCPGRSEIDWLAKGIEKVLMVEKTLTKTAPVV